MEEPLRVEKCENGFIVLHNFEFGGNSPLSGYGGVLEVIILPSTGHRTLG
jgi:hypothetical protein